MAEFCYLQAVISTSMLIYSPDISPRLKYTLDFIFSDILKLDFSTSDNKEELIKFSGAKLNYSDKKIDDIPFLESGSLLFDNDIKNQDRKIGGSIKWKNLTAFFPVEQNSIVPFDLFSAVFFLISRYEEYLPFEPDEHNRYHSKLSLATKFDFLKIPIVDLWIGEFGKILESLFPDEVKVKKPEFTFEPTIDIDNAWAFKHKGFIRTFGSIMKTGQSMERRSFRYQVLRGKQHDPFHKYDKMDMIHNEFGFTPKFFFLVGPYGKFDRNISSSKKVFRKLIHEVAAKYETGLHPSYSSDSDSSAIEKEKMVLEEIIQKDVKISRQHFLRLNFPQTYQTLVKANIFNDYTMGYADQPGFRAGTSHSFHFFDLQNNKATPLRVFPFQVMDAGLRDYEKCNPEQAIEKIKTLMDACKEAGGTFRSLWHNESFSEWQGWEGWTRVYKEMLRMAGTI